MSLKDILDEPGFYGVPVVVLEDPKFPHNVGAALRACSCFGAPSLWFTGNRIASVLALEKRLPREERMKGYRSVRLMSDDRPLDWIESVFTWATPVCVELREGSEPLTTFVHPEYPVYVFGPEDGSVSKALRARCHRFVYIPSRHCLNLAASVYVTLYDRMVKSGVNEVLAEERGVI